MAEKTYYDSKFNLAFGNIKRNWTLLNTLQWDTTMLTAKIITEIRVELIIALLQIVVS